MKHRLMIGLLAGFPAVCAFGQPKTPPPNTLPNVVLDQYCVTCHNQRARTGGLSLDKFDPANIGDNAEVAEKIVRKLRAGMMPP